eukprot:scaffold87774_cov15-Tisochrysis_lutea.AAC.1
MTADSRDDNSFVLVQESKTIKNRGIKPLNRHELSSSRTITCGPEKPVLATWRQAQGRPHMVVCLPSPSCEEEPCREPSEAGKSTARILMEKYV